MTVVRSLTVDLAYIRAAESWKAFGTKPNESIALSRVGFVVKDNVLYGMATNRYSIVAYRSSENFSAQGFAEGEYYCVPFDVLYSFVNSTKGNKNVNALVTIEWIDEDYMSVCISGAGAMSQVPFSDSSYPKILGLLDKKPSANSHPVTGVNIAQLSLLNKVRTKKLVKVSEHWTMTVTDSQSSDKAGPFVFTNSNDDDVVVLIQPHTNTVDYVSWIV